MSVHSAVLEYRKRLVAVIEASPNRRVAYREAGIHPSTFYRWRNRVESFVPYGGLSITDRLIEQQIVAETVITPTLPGESMLPAFTHLFSGGYAAGYYSYKWAEVLAADAFAAFREVGLDNDEGVREVAQRFYDTVLGLGGSLPAAEVYRLFRGRDAQPDALLHDQGLR